jgi:hypothetical protein
MSAKDSVATGFGFGIGAIAGLAALWFLSAIAVGSYQGIEGARAELAHRSRLEQCERVGDTIETIAASREAGTTREEAIQAASNDRTRLDHVQRIYAQVPKWEVIGAPSPFEQRQEAIAECMQ